MQHRTKERLSIAVIILFLFASLAQPPGMSIGELILLVLLFVSLVVIFCIPSREPTPPA